MRISFIVLATGLTLAPALAAAQSVDASGRIDTSGGGSVNSRIDTRASGALGRAKNDEAPLDVRRYVQTHPAAPGVAGSPGVGDTLTPNTAVRTVPGYPQWGYTSSGNGHAIVDRDNGAVTDVIR